MVHITNSNSLVLNWLKSLKVTADPVKTYSSMMQNFDLEASYASFDRNSSPSSSDSSGSSLFYEVLVLKDPEKVKTTFHHCYFCQSALPDERTLDQHISIHTLEKGYPCHLCPKQFRNDEKLSSHINEDHQRQSDQETVPLRRFKLKNEEEISINLSFRNEVDLDISNPVDLDNGQPTPRSGLKRRTRRPERYRTESEEEFERQVQASINILKMTNRENQPKTTHRKIPKHNRKTNCYLCSASFDFKRELKPHLIYHQIEGPFKCTRCKKRRRPIFEKYKFLEAHLESAHPGIKKPLYACTACPRISITPSAWRSHEKRHWVENAFWCYFCGRNYKRGKLLECHMAKHTREASKPFSCYFCELEFQTMQNLKQHLVSHTTEQPYICAYKHCRKYFRWYGSYFSHRKVHVREQLGDKVLSVVVKKLRL